MTTLDKARLIKKFKIIVGTFVALTIIYLLCPNKGGSVFWAIYSFALKDFFIVSLLSLFIGIDKICDLIAIGLMSYLLVPTIIRLNCAINSKFNYIAYRKVLCNSEYSYLLLLVIFFAGVLVYYFIRNVRNTRRNN